MQNSSWDSRFKETMIVIDGMDKSLDIIFIKLRPVEHFQPYLVVGILITDDGTLYRFFEKEGTITYVKIAEKVKAAEFSIIDNRDIIYWIHDADQLNFMYTDETNSNIVDFTSPIIKLYNFQNTISFPHYASTFILTLNGDLYVHGHVPKPWSDDYKNHKILDKVQHLASNVYTVSGEYNKLYIVTEN